MAAIEVERVIDPNVNKHNIYALLELTKKSSDIFGARYFVTFISQFGKTPKRWVDEDLETIYRLEG